MPRRGERIEGAGEGGRLYSYRLPTRREAAAAVKVRL